MSFHYVFPVVCRAAVFALAPAGVTDEDCEKRLLSVLRTELGKVDFKEVVGKSKAFKRLKIDRKANEVGYSAKMGGSSKAVASGALDLYDWLADVYVFESSWGQGSVTVSVPKEIHGYIGGLLATMKPSLAASVAIDASLEAGKEAVPFDYGIPAPTPDPMSVKAFLNKAFDNA